MKPRGMTVKNRCGEKIGRLTVLERAINSVERNAIRARWLCRCDCGKTIIVTGHSLGKAQRGLGGTRSCGCLMLEKPIKHGRTGTRAYRTWHMMLQRCTNPRNPAYKSYGGRGISVCDEWREFIKFYADVGDPPHGMTLDRIDNSLGYSKANCRWATRIEQGNNRRTNRLIAHDGENLTMAQWAKKTGLGIYCLRNRLASGWTIEKAISTPKRNRIEHI